MDHNSQKPTLKLHISIIPYPERRKTQEVSLYLALLIMFALIMPLLTYELVSLDPFFEDYIEQNDLNVPLELRIDQVDDLMPTIKEGQVVEEFRATNDNRIFGYPSYCDYDKKIRIDCAYNLKFSCMIGFEFLHANF
ncbi:hypothetical protein Tco_1342888 [Tanacetum coccineum]